MFLATPLGLEDKLFESAQTACKTRHLKSKQRYHRIQFRIETLSENTVSEIIRMDDPTSHGGKVIEGSMFDICHGKPIAFIGHKTFCPLCKGTFPIIEGALMTTFYGKGVALAGMKTACGATLIPTQFTDVVEHASGNHDRKRSQVSVQTRPSDTPQPARQFPSVEAYDIHFCITNASGAAMVDCPYVIVMESGQQVEGRTDHEGKTVIVNSLRAEQATLHVFERDVAPINPSWDR